MSKAERDVEIIQRYVAGVPLEELCLQFKLTRGRIYQILNKAGTPRVRQGNASDRDQFLGINLSPEDKEALRAEAARRGLSMSMLTSDLIKEMLASLPSGI